MASPSTLVYFNQQVAGHDKLMSMPTSNLIIVKPCTKKEVDFYQDAQGYPDLLDFIAECYGTLRAATEKELELLDSTELNDSDDIRPFTTHIIINSYSSSQNLCLENISHGFTRPCIMDLKMGSLLYDQDATTEKRNRMIHHSKTTTSGSLGLRISGMKVYDSIDRRYATYQKAYGKSRTPENIKEAILAYLFPTSRYGKASEEYRIYVDDLSQRQPTTTTTDVDQLEPQQQEEKQHIIREKLPTKYTRWIIECFIDTIKELRAVIMSHPNLRLIGSSILFIYEGDRTVAEKTWNYMLEEDSKPNKKDKQKGNVAEDEEVEEDETDTPKMCDLRLIDFAHSDWQAEREEQDPELLKGFSNIIDILEECLKEQKLQNL
ncbi:hypothetical protein BDF20DRAFT_909110 [Mycotypha africana]|uniref:uncharacterized protein n=1 Tax=Mycotypha africana TaxID=64632 RepID=UPI002301D477|nr:uncharacterized protein BDF20DRAFT_909110 [Mycotypha africana]KAI8991312.1 hypothetical protein BDF20DRAFT_909110 [Mycotypha africana]